MGSDRAHRKRWYGRGLSSASVKSQGEVAIKVISEDILQDIEEKPEEVSNAIQRLQVEVQTMAQVRHPNVLQIYNYGSISVQQQSAARQLQYITMEYVSGNTFRYTMSEEGFYRQTNRKRTVG
jgi:serine/threonine-protein kinase